jgi:hypothetical protein
MTDSLIHAEKFSESLAIYIFFHIKACMFWTMAPTVPLNHISKTLRHVKKLNKKKVIGPNVLNSQNEWGFWR